MVRRTRLAATIAAAAVLALVASCSGAASDAKSDDTSAAAGAITHGTLPSDGPPEQGGILTANDPSDAPTLDPHKSATAYAQAAVEGIVYSKLLEFKTGRDIPYGSSGLKGDLAETWSHSDDGLTWTFNLHKGVKFQNVAPVNGREFTSADVVCTITRIKTLPGVQLNLVDIVKTVEAPDPYTVVFKLGSPYGAFDETMASFYMGILPCEGTRGEFNLAEQAIGTGPYILKEWNRKVQRTYVRNPDYFVAGKPHLDEIHIVILADPAAAMASVRTGALDLTGSVNETLLPSLVASNPEVAVRTQLASGPDQIMFNQTRKPFGDYRVRKAIAMAWDRKGMSEQYYPDGIMAGPIPANLFGGMPSDEALKSVPYDPDGAKKLLAEAGYPNGLDLTMLTTDGYGPQFVTQAQWVQEDLKKIGVNVTLRILDYATYFSAFQAKDYDIGWGLSTGFLTADEWLQAVYKSNGPRNWFGTNDPKLDALIAAQEGLVDKDDREKKLEEINSYIMDNILDPFMGIQYTGLLTQQPWVHNYYAHPAYQRSWAADVWLSTEAPSRKK
jgi:peptide/nickel transport system substrate-binding protein